MTVFPFVKCSIHVCVQLVKTPVFCHCCYFFCKSARCLKNIYVMILNLPYQVILIFLGTHFCMCISLC